MVQEAVRDMREPLFDLAVIGQHRFAADVGRGGHQRPAELVQQQVMQRAVGQHHAELVQARRDPF